MKTQAIMSAANPYATQLAKENPFDVIRDTSRRLKDFAEQLGAQGLERSLAQGKWSAREIICHLADTELAFAFRLRQALAEPHHVIQPFDQEAWAKPYGSFKADDALTVFSAVRNWNIALLQTVPQDHFTKPLTHPERGQMTFQTLVETMAGHDLNHLRQLQTIASGS